MQFDISIFAIVPKYSQMVVHFLSQSFESATLYHNTPFSTQHLSHEFLFSRFAWSIIKLTAYTVGANKKAFGVLVATPPEQTQGEARPGGSTDVGPQGAGIDEAKVTAKAKKTNKRKAEPDAGAKNRTADIKTVHQSFAG
jgi:hypothetical protein